MSRRRTKGGNNSAQNMRHDRNRTFEAMLKAYGVQPTDVNGQLTVRTEFYKNKLKQIIKGLFEIKCPDTWDKDYFLDVLLFEGKVCITNTAAGVVPLRCSTFGVNMYNRASGINIANPVLGELTRTKDVDAVLFYLIDDKWFNDLNPIVDIYAEKLASADAAIEVNLMNSKVAWVCFCDSTKQAQEMKHVYDMISRGEPAVFVGNRPENAASTYDFFNSNVKNNYVADLIQTEKKSIMNEFLTLIGINNANTEKKERLIVDEVNGNNDEIECNIKLIKNNIQDCEKRTNAMFGDILHIGMPYWENRSTVELKGGADANTSTGNDNG